MKLSDSALIRIAIISSLIGIAGLYLLSGRIEISDKTASRIDSGDLDKVVSLSGTVKRVRAGGEFSVVTLEKTELVDIVVFDNISRSGISVGDLVRVKGRVKEYGGDYELIADEIKEHSQ